MMKDLNRGIFILLAVMTALCMAAGFTFADTSEGPFPQWGPDTPVRDALAGLLERVTDGSSADQITMKDIITALDMDETLVRELFPEWLDVVLLPDSGSDDAEAAPVYTLDRAVVLSRHNIRSPLSGSGSLLGDITPHEWFEWTSKPSELSLRGAMLETLMGQYFRLWLEKEDLFPENYRPGEEAVRFYANAKQRTLATSRYFSAGLLPVENEPVETHAEYDTMDPVFSPVLTYLTDAYAEAVLVQIAEKGGDAGPDGIRDGLKDAIILLMDVTDMDRSEAYQAGTFGDLLEDGTVISLELGKEPAVSGPIKTATSVADALTFQYYEMEDDREAAFGHDLTVEDWRKLHTIVDTYTDILFGTPLLSVNVAHPLLMELRSELEAEGREFSFLCGHDSNVASVLSALGAEDYLLPDTVEQHTPIGVKLVFSRWLDEDDEPYWSAELVYQTTDQLRGLTSLSLAAGSLPGRTGGICRSYLHPLGCYLYDDGYPLLVNDPRLYKRRNYYSYKYFSGISYYPEKDDL